MKFDITIKGEAFYPDIEAETEEEAKELAELWFVEREFEMKIEKKEEDFK